MNAEEPKSASSRGGDSRPAWGQLFRTTEGRILLLGVAVALAGLLAMAVLAYWSPQTSRMMGVLAFFNIVFGRVVSMSIGYAAGYTHALVIPVNMWVETVLVLLFYPVFVFSMRKLVVLPSLKRFLERTRATAERHHDKVRRYGIIGLFFFVWFPFWMTGPVVGSAIGYLLGFPSWLTLSIVLTGTYLAMGGWAYLMFGLYSRAVLFGPWAPALIIGLIILFVLAGYWLNRHGKAQRELKTKQAAGAMIDGWSDDRASAFLDQQRPNDAVEWIVLDEAGVYGFTDTNGSRIPFADEDKARTAGIIRFLLSNGGSYRAANPDRNTVPGQNM